MATQNLLYNTFLSINIPAFLCAQWSSSTLCSPAWPPHSAATSNDANEQRDDVSSIFPNGPPICCQHDDLLSYTVCTLCMELSALIQCSLCLWLLVVSVMLWTSDAQPVRYLCIQHLRLLNLRISFVWLAWPDITKRIEMQFKWLCFSFSVLLGLLL